MATPQQAMAAARAAKVAELADEAKQFTPAGYLPAPPAPRFISAAEESAKKLPASMKAESIKNALIKGGAKPAELEYAGIDKFLADRKGQRVSAADVLAHIEREGPLGQLGRVDQRPPSEAEADASLSRSRADGWGRISAEPIPRLANIRKPFDEDAAYPSTVYSNYTEQGKRGDTSGYREVLFADPKNPGRLRDVPPGMPAIANRFAMQQSGPVDAHNSDYWVRYHSNPNEIAVQNIQSDIGQRISKEASERPSELRDLNQRLDELYALEDRYLSLPDDHPEKADRLKELSETISDAVDYGHDGFRGTRGADGRWKFSAYAPDPASPISRDDKWKDFLARQIVLEAAAQGKPITLPTALNAHAVEGMPVQAAEAFYERDMPDRIRKILKEFDPKGGGGSRRFFPDPPRGMAYSPQKAKGQRAALWPDVVDSMRQIVGEPPPLPADASQPAPIWHTLATLLQDDPRTWGREIPFQIERVGNWLPELPNEWSPDAARRLGMLYGLLERSTPQAALADAPRSGTHIELTPVARRNILERGMPILSVPAAVAAGAAAQQEQPGLLDGLNRR